MDTCTLIFFAAVLTRAKIWKQPKCPLTDEWLKKMQYIYVMEYYSAIKKNGCGSVVVRQMNLEPVIQSEVSQKEKNKEYIYEIQKNGTDEPSREQTCGQR